MRYKQFIVYINTERTTFSSETLIFLRLISIQIKVDIHSQDP